ncbi:MAG: hypothetical protein MUC97_13705 [Bernardetiaceae bacterium]|nr:hypothetical protein [Bernardetiaceae bacterium]
MKNDFRALTQKLDSIEEYERQPVPPEQVKGFRSFIGMVAGEHIAGTEFVIGPLFVLHGAAAADVFLGLLVGNILATLSWAVICAPLATKTRLTIFYQLEKICGFKLVSIYNVINGLQFCVLAASMIGVSATAVGLALDMPMPGLTDLYPTSLGWVVAVLLIGSVIAVVAVFGYDQVAHFSNICAPWMPGGVAAVERPLLQRLLAGGPAKNLDGRARARAKPIHPLAHYRVCLAVQHFHARGPGRYEHLPLRQAQLVRPGLGGRHVRGPLHGLGGLGHFVRRGLAGRQQ